MTLHTRFFFVLTLLLCAWFAALAQRASAPVIEETRYIYLGNDDVSCHLVWEEHPAYRMDWYVIEKSYDGNRFFSVDSVQPFHLFDIHANNYPDNINYYDRILYSTETGSGRFIYNDVRGVDEAGEKNFWYRIKMVKPNGEKIFTKTVVKSFSFGIADIDRLREVGGTGEGNQRGGGVLLGDGDGTGVGAGRGSGPCPNVQAPPSGYIFNGGVRTFYGDCCYWEEREYVTQQITEACNGVQSWCCPRDCAPLAYDPCCYHICNEYNQCSCHPWTCCDVASGAIWIVTASTTYTLGASMSGIQNPTCNGNYDGAATLNYLDGIPPINYSWDNGALTGSVLNQLAAGIYTLTVSDANGCSETLSFNLVDPPLLTSSLTSSDVSCFGFNDGFIDVSVTGGTLPYSYTWTGGNSNGATSQDLTGIGPGNYALTVTDANNCVSNQFIPVFSPDEFAGVITFLDLGCLDAGSAVLELCCYGTNTGSAVLSLSGGTPPNTFIWSNGVTTSINTDLDAGNYAVTAVDANGCSFATNSTLGQRDEILLSTVTTTATCGSCNAIAFVHVNGGSGLFNFDWPASAGSQTTSNGTGLCAGSYTVTVSDAFAAGCTETINVAISNNGGETISTSHTDASCAGACNGTASVSFNCSSPPCTVAWYDPTGGLLAQTNTVNNLCEGSYSVVVTNSAGCITSETVAIQEGAPIAVSLSVTQETCPSACDGAAAATPAGGSSPYTYQWQDGLGNPLPLQTSASIQNLCPGSYRVRVTDAAGCSVLEDFTIVPNVFSISATPLDLECNAVCNGSATVDVSGGAGPFAYQWLDGANNPIAGATSATALNLCAGTYYAQVSTSTGCTLTSPAVILSEPDAITVAMNSTDIPCAGQCIGDASIIASGGAGGYTYQWYNAANVAIAGETNPAITNLCEGAYSVIVTDANGCATEPQQVVISVLSTIDIEIAPENISCNNANDGSITITVTGGTAPLTFSWNNGAFTDQNIFNLSEGLYTVVVTDATGCTATTSAYIVNPGTLTATATPYVFPNSAHVSCHNGTNGRATVVASGGTAPFNYLWSDSQQAPIAIGLSLGTYTVTVTDASGCSATTDVTLYLNPPPILTTLVADTFIGGWNVSCFGASDGFIDLTVTNGTPPLVYSWQPVNIVFIEDLPNASAITYTVIVTDTVNGCSVSDSITLTEPPALSASFQPTDASCRGGNDGAIDVAVSGGTPGYSYSWNNGTFATQHISNLTAGTYIVSITDTNGCALVDSAFVAEPTDIPFSTIALGTCRDSFFIGGGYQTVSGTYYDTVQYGAGCDSVVITDLQFVTSFLVFDSVSICEGTSYFVGGALQTQAGTYYDTLIAAGNCDSVIQTLLTLLPPSAAFVDTAICSGTFYFAAGANQSTPGIYYDTLPAANGCDSIVQTALDVISVQIIAQPDSATVQAGSTVSITVAGGSGNMIYNWSPTLGLSCEDTDCGSITIIPTGDITYTVIAEDEFGCSDTSFVVVVVRDTLIPDSEFPLFYVPNAFTPNGDGNNDEFRVTVSEFSSFRLLVFNRWGEKLFETDNPANGWDGTYRGKLQNPGAYVYYVDVSFINNVKPPDYLKYNKGSVTLIR